MTHIFAGNLIFTPVNEIVWALWMVHVELIEPSAACHHVYATVCDASVKLLSP